MRMCSAGWKNKCNNRRERNAMKNLFFILTCFFVFLTFVGGGYVIVAGANAGFAIIPMVFALICLQVCKAAKTKENRKK